MTYFEFSHLYRAGAIDPHETMLVTRCLSWGTSKMLEKAWIIFGDPHVTEVEFVNRMVSYDVREERELLARNLPIFFWAERIYGL